MNVRSPAWSIRANAALLPTCDHQLWKASHQRTVQLTWSTCPSNELCTRKQLRDRRT